MEDKLYDVLIKLPRANLINLMWDALDTMQGYNGHSRTFCIAQSLGLENYRDGWKIIPLAQIKRNTEHMPGI